MSDGPGVSLEAFQEHLRMRAASESQAGTSTSVPPSIPLDEVETVYSCAVGVPSKTNEQRLTSLRSWYQILDNLNPRLAIHGEWCCNPRFGKGVYEAYLLEGLKLPFNAFAKELLTRLGLGVCQYNPNAWRLVVSMQVLWREVFEVDCPLTVDEFLYCYKPLEINQSVGFYQFIARGKDCRLIKSLVTSDRNWKTEFFFISSFCHRGNKKAKHGSSKPEVVKSSLPILPTSQPSIQVHDVDSSVPIEVTPSKTTAPISSQPSPRIPMNPVKNEDLAWERF
ncbi:hypothetical protein SO802_022204 [Lithocarpus litseifolius]|uniref:Uncharacterized protein n=1 Tax=Lithocarpus litseifolius TaxID=425828 RepID=A0AAW2CJ24_9ROSI